MLDLKRKPTGATIAIGIAILCFLSLLLVPRDFLQPGFGIFLCWAALCAGCVLADRLLAWAMLTCSALLFVSLDWWMQGPPSIDEFGYDALDAIALFTGTALVVAGTGTLSIVRTSMRAQRHLATILRH